MTNKEKIIALIEEKRTYLETEFGVKKIGLFGSYEKGT
ncbi:MAG: nucleotidyltransferase, partial [Anaerolineales bacterium]|nr:nucleotidyltransferase [Anaerolineales bacterium]